MKKSIFVAGLVAWVLVGSAQVTKKEEPPKPPLPPKPPVEKVKDVPPPPPPSEPPSPNEPPPPPEPPIPPVPPQEDFPDDYKAFMKRNPTVESLGWNHKNEIIVRFKSGKEERYNLADEKSRKAAIAKYGELPTAPPPPPPPPPAPDAPEPPAKKTKRTTLS